MVHHHKQLEELTASSDGAWQTKAGHSVAAIPVGRPKSIVLLLDETDGRWDANKGHAKIQEECPRIANAFARSENNWVQGGEYNLLAIQYYRIDMLPKRPAAALKTGRAYR